jgi:hypothetical protein
MNLSTTHVSDFKEYAVWIVAMVLVTVGFRYAKDVIAFVLDKLYQYFIQDYPAGA